MRTTTDLELRADCARCAGLCCVALAFAASADFALDKPAGTPCQHLAEDFRCGIHARLREAGFPGCVAYDCFGAGQHLVQATFGGRDWRRSPGEAAAMFDAFAVMRQLHELAWYLVEALAMAGAVTVHAGLREALDEVELLARGTPAELAAVDVADLRTRAGVLLGRASELVREGPVSGSRAADRPRALDKRGADLAGADLHGADLRGANLRSAMLIGADLRRADLRLADLAGADLRGADLRGADLRGSLFLTGSQLATAKGGAATRLSMSMERPAHW